VSPEIPHGFQAQAAGGGIRAVGVKVLKANADARQEAQRVIPFHTRLIHQIPGLPNPHVQRTLEAGFWPDARGQERACIVQEWVEGVTLEELVRRQWVREPVDGSRVRLILEQLLGGIIIPLWGAGTIWWDVRDANCCWNEPGRHLTLIDVDALAAYADEIVATPHVWERRETGRRTALGRLRQMTLRLLLAQGAGTGKGLRTALPRLWHSELEPALRALGPEPWRREERIASAATALHRFFDSLDQSNFLRCSRL
jgi:hypothetical protein